MFAANGDYYPRNTENFNNAPSPMDQLGEVFVKMGESLGQLEYKDLMDKTAVTMGSITEYCEQIFKMIDTLKNEKDENNKKKQKIQLKQTFTQMENSIKQMENDMKSQTIITIVNLITIVNQGKQISKIMNTLKKSAGV